ncbi:MAG TPA: M20 family metallopeptidase [Hyphomicrobiaceae bacterium]|nr:M20 family metallopeptidase [Hyphomicrobiaceae bacterium]
MTTGAVDLAAELIRFNTINPPGQEAACTAHLQRLLSGAGFQCEQVLLGDGRPNLVARIGGNGDRPPIAFTGHTDTVPLGAQEWTVPPHDGLVRDGRLWGRGASDMKSGVAAFVVAAMKVAPRLEGTPGVILYITAGEETGSEGAFVLARRGMQGEAGALVVAEPSDNRPFCGHKGALWLTATTRGVTAHGSMPDKGVNAVYAAARAVSKLEAFDFNVARHAVMGAPTLNVGTIHGGLNVNSVPDRAEIGIDLRTLPGMRHDHLFEQLGSYLGAEVTLERRVDVPSVWTAPEDPWMRDVFEICAAVSGQRPAVEAAPYFTDASALTPALGDVPTVILGPGPTHMAHQTDEWCECARIEEAARIYEQLMLSWCERAR